MLSLCLLCSPFALGQQGGGIVTGSVRDTSGAVVPGAAIQVRNVATGRVFDTVTDGSGNFTTPSLQVGIYTVTASLNGFKRTIQRNVVVQTDTRPQVNLVLQVGATSNTVEVSGAAAAMNTSTPAVGTVIAHKAVANLPLNGRNALALVIETPGVRSNGGNNFQGFADRGTLLSAVSINGGPSGLNGNLLDGANNLQTYYGEISINPDVDAIQEFNVETGVLPAEDGFTLGGLINMTTRSGTNSYHGSIYEFLRNDALDARNYFLAPTARKPELRYNQYGGALGGPIQHDKTFFFANYEGYRYLSSSVIVGTVPTPQERTGDFSDLFGTNGKLIPLYNPSTTSPNPSGPGFVRSPYPGNVITDPLDPVAVNIQKTVYPEPNRTPTNALTHANNYEATVPNHRSMQQALGRIDHTFSEKQTAFLRYAYYNSQTDNGGSNGSFYTAPEVTFRNDSLTNQSAIIADTYSFSPTLVNEFRLAGNRTYFPFVEESYNQGWPQKLGMPANVPSTTFPKIDGNGMPTMQSGTVGIRASTNIQVIDIVGKVLGAHSLRMGLNWQINRGNNFQMTNPSGDFSFSSALTGNPQAPQGTGSGYASFLLGDVASATIGTYLGEAERNYSISGFAEDSYHATQRLTLSLGLRYDFQKAPVEQNNGYSNFNPYVTNPLNGFLGEMQYAGVDGAPRSFRKSAYHDFGPRIGFAMDVFGNGKTSLRGGYGIYYATTFAVGYFGNTAGFAQTNTSYTAPGGNTNFPAFKLQDGLPSPPIQPLGAKLGPSGFLGTAVSYEEPRGVTPMSQQYNLMVQQEIPYHIVLEAGYLGNYGTHVAAGSYNINQLNPQYLSLGTKLQNQVPNPYVGKVPGSLGGPTISMQQSLLAYPYYTSVSVSNPRDGIFHSNALELSATRQTSSGLMFVVGYTMSKLMDFSVLAPINYNGVSSTVGVVGYQNSFDRMAEYSLDPSDVSQIASISFVYQLPAGRGQRFLTGVGGLANRLIGGWQINGIVQLQTGTPLTITGANNNAATRPNFVQGVSPKLKHPSINQWFNTAAFVNPPSYTYGNVPRALGNVRGPGMDLWDLSLFKTTQIHDQLALQFRLESFNTFNHPTFGLPNMSFVPGANGLNASGSFGSISHADDGRAVQLALKLLF